MEFTTREEGTEVAKVEDVIPQPKEKKQYKGKGGLYMSKGSEKLRVKYIVK